MGRLRFPILLCGLAGAIAIFVHDPSEPVDLAAVWRVVDEVTHEGDGCPTAPALTGTRWETRVEGGEPYPTVHKVLRKVVSGGCRGATCPASGTARVRVQSHEDPNLFTGYSRSTAQVHIEWEGGACRRSAAWAVELEVDQGRRGEARIARGYLGNVIGRFVLGHEWLARRTAAIGPRDSERLAGSPNPG